MRLHRIRIIEEDWRGYAPPLLPRCPSGAKRFPGDGNEGHRLAHATDRGFGGDLPGRRGGDTSRASPDPLLSSPYSGYQRADILTLCDGLGRDPRRRLRHLCVRPRARGLMANHEPCEADHGLLVCQSPGGDPLVKLGLDRCSFPNPAPYHRTDDERIRPDGKTPAFGLGTFVNAALFAEL